MGVNVFHFTLMRFCFKTFKKDNSVPTILLSTIKVSIQISLQFNNWLLFTFIIIINFNSFFAFKTSRHSIFFLTKPHAVIPTRTHVQCITVKLQSQTKIVRTLPPNAIFSLLGRLLVLPMLIIAVNSPKLARQLWKGKKTAKCPKKFD